MRGIAGKVAFVTGGAGDIGRQAALLFSFHGASVAVVDKNEIAAANTVKAIEANGGRAVVIQADLASELATQHAFERALEAFGKVDFAFNNAGINSSRKRFHELSGHEWEKMIAVNLSSVFYCMKSELAHMTKSGGGVIVNTSSGAGIIAAPGQPHYTAAKHGVLALTKVAASEYAAEGVRINAICPGVVDTGMVRQFTQLDPELESSLISTLPARRLGRPEEVAEAAVWLCSDGASFISGATLAVDGASVCR